MEVTATHAPSGVQCCVEVSGDETVGSFKAKALAQMFPGAGTSLPAEAALLQVRVRGHGAAVGTACDDAMPFSSTAAEDGAEVDLVREFAPPTSPASYDTHNCLPLCLALSHCGRLCAVGLLSGGVSIWDTTTAQCALHDPTGGPLVSDMAFSPCARRLAVCAGALLLYDRGDWGAPRELLGGPGVGVVSCAAWAPCSGRLVAATAQGVTVVCDSSTGAQLLVVEPDVPGSVVCAVAVTPSRLLLMGGTSCALRVCRLDSGLHVATHHGHAKRVTAIRIVSPGREQHLTVVTCGDDAVVRVWRLSGSAVVWVRAHPVEAQQLNVAVTTTEADVIVAGGRGTGLFLWSLSTGEPLTDPHPQPIAGMADSRALAISPCGTCVFLSRIDPVAVTPTVHVVRLAP